MPATQQAVRASVKASAITESTVVKPSHELGSGVIQPFPQTPRLRPTTEGLLDIVPDVEIHL